MTKFCQIKPQLTAVAPVNCTQITEVRWQVLNDVVAALPRLGLNQASATLLRALLSFLPKGNPSHLTVFPSNKSISERSDGMQERRIARHLKALIDCGLILRKKSPNGKRYRKKSADGLVAHVFGFDLSPCFARHDEIKAMRLNLDYERRQTSFLREELSLIRGQLEALGLAPVLCLEIRKDSRRKPDMERMQDLLEAAQAALPSPDMTLNMTVSLSESDAPEAAISKDMSGNDGHIVCHQQRSNKDYKDSDGQGPKTDPREQAPKEQDRREQDSIDLAELVESCPNATFASPTAVRTWHQAHRLAWELSRMLGITQQLMQEAGQRLGDIGLTATIFCLCQKTETIRSHGGYLRRLCAKADSFKPASFLAQIKRADQIQAAKPA